MEDQISKLKKKIESLEEADPDSIKLKEYKSELKQLTKSRPPAGDDAFELDMSPEELDAVPTGFSNRPVAGEYVAEIGYPEKDYSAKAAKVPFTIIEGGWKGFDKDAFYPSKTPGAEFSIKNICESAGVLQQVNPKTGKAFYPLSELAGKVFVVIYKDETSSFVGNDGIEREVTRAKVKKAKPYRAQPKVESLMT